MNRFRNKEFKDLQAYWYDIAKQTGFEDCEYANGVVKTEVNYRAAKLKVKASIKNYFSLASDILHSHEFKTELEKQIWDLHCQGLSIRETNKQVNCPVSTIHLILKRIQKKYGLK